MKSGKYFNASGRFMGLLFGMLFGWFPLLLVSMITGIETMSHEDSVIGFALSYAVSIPLFVVVFSYATWKDGLGSD